MPGRNSISDSVNVPEDADATAGETAEQRGETGTPTSTATTSSERRSGSYWWLAMVGGLLLLEICLLTVPVEFSKGPMAYLASPKGATFLLMTAVLGLLLCGNDLLQAFLNGGSSGPRAGWIWLGANIVVFAMFFWWTWWLSAPRNQSAQSGGLVWGWPGGAMLVGGTAVLACFSARCVVGWLREHWYRWVGASIIVATFILWIGNVQHLWSAASESTLAISAAVLESVQSKGVMVAHEGVRHPQIGLINGSGLRVTRFCAEMESLVGFWVIGLTVLAATWRSNRKIRYLCVMVAGTVAMFLLNGTRLAALVLVAEWSERGHLATRLAHSRISGILFLAFMVLVLLGTYRWWHRRAA